jgi:cell division protein FtsW
VSGGQARSRQSSPVARYVLLGATLLLALGGLVMIYSASAAYDFVKYADSAYHLKRQVIYLVVGLLAMWAASRVPPGRMKALGWWILIAADIALVAVLVVGSSSHGAKSWLDLGFTTLQPSEFAKLGCIMTLAGVLADLGRLAAIMLPALGLIILQPDFGTAVSLLVPAVLLAIVGGLEKRYVALIAAGVAIAVPFMVMARSYRVSRLLTFLDPWADPGDKGYQIVQALLAFGSGGVGGLGLGMSRQKYFYLPEAQNDFIFAIIGEELGLWGTLLVVMAFLAFAWAGFRIAMDAKDAYGRLVAAGLTIVIVTQAIMNMAAVTNLMPVTGIPLPLVSSGGSSMLFTMLCVGLILSVARRGRVRDRVPVPGAGGSDEERDSARTGERRGHGRPRLSVVDGGRAASRRRA